MPPTTLDIDEPETMYAERGYQQWVPADRYVPDFASCVNQALRRLAALPLDWDHEGAPRIDHAIIEAARRFISQLPKDINSIPVVVPMAKGNLQFEWSKGQRSLELEIETPATIRYLKWHPEADIEEEDSFDINDTDQAVALILWFMKGEEDA
jgi:hypothetical protein